jgi:hypothetical protein
VQVSLSSGVYNNPGTYIASWDFVGNFEQATKLAIQEGDNFSKVLPGDLMIMMETFHRGVALYAMALRTQGGKSRGKLRKYERL